MQRINSPKPQHSGSAVLIGIFILALAIRVAAVAYWQSRADDEGVLFRFGDSYSYWDAARASFDGRSAAERLRLDSQIFRAPGYPSFLQLTAWLQSEWAAVLAARLLGCLLGAYCVCFIYDAAGRFGGRWAAMIAGGLAAIYPGAVGMSVFILSEALFCPLMLLNLRAAAGLVEILPANHRLPPSEVGPRVWLGRGLAAGFLAGFAVLVKPVWILWPGAIVAYLAAIALWSARRNEALRRTSVLAACVVFGFAAVMTPWWLHNYRLTGRFVPTTLQVGATLYDSLHEGASGGSDEDMRFVDRFAADLKAERAAAAAGGSPEGGGASEGGGAAEAGGAAGVAERPAAFSYELDRRLKTAALNWAAENPSDVLRLALIKFARTWTPLPQAAQVGGAAIRWSEAVCYVIVVVLAAFGLASSRRSEVAVYALPLGYFAVIHSVFVGSVRYRQPAVLAACVLAGLGAAQVIVLWRERKRREATMENGGRR